MLPSSVGTDTSAEWNVGILHFCRYVTFVRFTFRLHEKTRTVTDRWDADMFALQVYVEAVELKVRTTRVGSVSTFVRVAPRDIFQLVWTEPEDRRRRLHLKDISCCVRTAGSCSRSWTPVRTRTRSSFPNLNQVFMCLNLTRASAALSQDKNAKWYLKKHEVSGVASTYLWCSETNVCSLQTSYWTSNTCVSLCVVTVLFSLTKLENI